MLRNLLVPTGGTPDAQQRMLGRTMQALYDDAILQGPLLVPDAQSNSVAMDGDDQATPFLVALHW
ncbi:hypothetical protein OG729_38515 [Streptomyces sp. NBC_00210]|uniref:hypothetical protein n=1 Tax=unclassified Streptomyces TaxID=2593676 RepID=UPI003243A4D4